MGGDRAAFAQEPVWRASGERPARDQRHHPCVEGGLPLAGLSSGLWPANNHLQSLPALDDQGRLAAAVCSLGHVQPRRCPHDRFHQRQGPPLGRRRKRGAQIQAIGRSRGGRTTKIHAVVDGQGRLIAFEITAGQRGDAPFARPLLETLPSARLCLADTAYDADKLRTFLIERGTTPVIPNNPTRKRIQPFDPQAYKQRNLVERMFCRLKDWRRVATRYDKLATTFASNVFIAAIIIWWTQ